jgi:hypothetical protein
MNKFFFTKFWQHDTYARQILNLFTKKLTLTKSFLESIRKFYFGSSLVVSIFNMHVRRPNRPHMAIEPKSKSVPVERLLLVSPYNI